MPEGMLSAVENRQDNRTLLVRARERSHLAPLQRWMATCGFARIPVITTSKADYPFRMVVPKPMFGDFLAYRAARIAYPNFKDEAEARIPVDNALKSPQRHYVDALHAIWTSMYKAFGGFRPL